MQTWCELEFEYENDETRKVEKVVFLLRKV